MSLRVKIFTYALWIFPLIDAFNFAMSFNTISLFRVGFGIAVAYFTVNWSLKLGGAFYLFATVVLSLLILATGGEMPWWLYFFAAFMAGGAYSLLLSPIFTPEDRTAALAEYSDRELDYEYKGFQVYKSPNFYWNEKEHFRSAKDVEAYIEDLIAIRSEDRTH